MVGKRKPTCINIYRGIEMLTKEYLKDHFIDAYFIDNERENIEVQTTSPDGKSVYATVIPFEKPGEDGKYPSGGESLEALKSVMSVDDLHERTFNKKKEEKKLFDEQVMRIAKKDGLILDETKVDPKHFPSVINAIINEDTNEDHLFALKLALFEVNAISESKDEEAKSAIRKSTSKSETMMNALKLICGK